MHQIKRYPISDQNLQSVTLNKGYKVLTVQFDCVGNLFLYAMVDLSQSEVNIWVRILPNDLYFDPIEEDYTYLVSLENRNRMMYHVFYKEKLFHALS